MASTVVAPDRGRVLVALLASAWVIGLAVFVASTVVVGRDERSVVFDTYVYSALALGAALLAILRPLLVRRGRLLWSVNAMAISVYAAGDILYSFYVVELDPEPYPSWADALWLAYYVLVVVFLLALLRTRARAVNRSTAVDGLVVGLGAAAATAAVSFDVILDATLAESGQQLNLESATSLGYPVGALLLLGTAGGALAVMGWRVGLQWWALVLGGLLFASADTVYALLTATVGYTDGGPLDTMWLLALGLQASAGWLLPRHARHVRDATLLTLWLPLAFATAALALLVLAQFQELSLLALALAAVTVAAALLRITLTVTEVRQLAVTQAQAMTDELTGLPNRRQLDAALRSAVSGGAYPVGLLMLDLDRFKDVNDSLGHPTGDTLLVEVARRLQGSVSGDEVVARLGGDEFAVLLPGTHGRDLERRASATAALLRPPVDLGHLSLEISASVGAASSPVHADTPSNLLRAADVAMYRAKRRGTGVSVYDPSADTASAEHLRVLEDFRATFTTTGVRCTYRPVVDLRTGALRRLVAEPRWRHPRLGSVPTREVHELSERTGLLRELTEHVIGRALADAAAWSGVRRGVPVSVRLSPVELLDAQLPATVTRALTEHGVPAERLLLECSEEGLAAEPERSSRALAAIHAAGVRIGVTGYGTGALSLSYVRHLPLVALTVDRSLTSAVARDAGAAAVLRAAVGLGHDLGLEVGADDVTDPAVLVPLAALGVDVAEGPVVEPVAVGRGRPARPPDGGGQASGPDTTGVASSAAKPSPLGASSVTQTTQ